MLEVVKNLFQKKTPEELRAELEALVEAQERDKRAMREVKNTLTEIMNAGIIKEEGSKYVYRKFGEEDEPCFITDPEYFFLSGNIFHDDD